MRAIMTLPTLTMCPASIASPLSVASGIGRSLIVHRLALRPGQPIPRLRLLDRHPTYQFNNQKERPFTGALCS
jgi:hypothetical protein